MAMRKTRADADPCSIARSLTVLGERWTILIVRDAVRGTTRFADFRAGLGIAPDVLTDRLATLVEAGVMEKRPYREPGDRVRYDYHLTEAGEALLVVLGALQQWGDDYRPRREGPLTNRRTLDGDHPVRVAFVDDEGKEVAPENVTILSDPTGR